MTSFKDLQDSFQRAVLQGDAAILGDIRKSDKESRETLLGVYQNAYSLRLIEFLDNEYEKLSLLLGDDQWDAMTRAYIGNTLSHSPNARHYGAKLPEFLRDNAPFSDIPILGDMADFERALNHAFDAANDQPLKMEDLATVLPEDWPGLNFHPHASVTRINLNSNARAIWQALDKTVEPPAIEVLDEVERIISFRQDLRTMYRSLTYEEGMLWDEMANGLNFGGLNELSATYGGEDEASLRVASYLKGWIETDMLILL